MARITQPDYVEPMGALVAFVMMCVNFSFIRTLRASLRANQSAAFHCATHRIMSLAVLRELRAVSTLVFCFLRSGNALSGSSTWWAVVRVLISKLLYAVRFANFADTLLFTATRNRQSAVFSRERMAIDAPDFIRVPIALFLVHGEFSLAPRGELIYG